MISGFFNYASMHPVKTALYGVGLALATPFLLPWLAPALVAPAASLANIFALAAIGTGAAYAGINTIRNIGPLFHSASANSGKIMLGGFGLGVAAPYAAPLLGPSLAGPALAFAGVAAPAALLLGAALTGVKLVTRLTRPSVPRRV